MSMRTPAHLLFFLLFLLPFSAFSQCGWTELDNAHCNNSSNIDIDENDNIYRSYWDSSRIKLVKYDGSNFSLLTDVETNIVTPLKFYLKTADGGIIYVAYSYMDAGSFHSRIKKYTNGVPATIYDNVGTVIYAFKVDNNGMPYFSSGVNSGTSVLKYNGSSWDPIGTSPGNIVDVAIDAMGAAYVVISDNTNNSYPSLTVKGWGGSSWITVGSPYLTTDEQGVGIASLTFDENYSLYLSYSEKIGVRKFCLRKFANNAWTNVFTPQTSTYWVNATVIPHNNGTVELTYWFKGQKVYFKKYANNAWTDISTTLTTTGVGSSVIELSSVVTSTGTRYVSGLYSSVRKLTRLNTKPAKPLLAASALTFCAGNTITLTATSMPGGNYSWYRNDTLVATTTASTYSVGIPGKYKVIFTSNFGCAAPVSKILTIKMNPLPNPSFFVLTTYANGSVKLRATAGGTYQWYESGTAIPGATGRNYLVTTGGVYSLRVTNTNGCVAFSANSTISISPRPAPVAEGQPFTEVADAAQGLSITVSPNPSSGVFHIGSSKALHAVVTDIQGRKVADKQQATEVDLSAQPAGVYILTLYDEQKKPVKVLRLLKQ